MQWNPTVLDLEGLRIEAHPRPSHFDRWFDVRIAVTAHPFAGVLEAIFTDEDLTAFADALDRLDPDGEATLGGNRSAELRLVAETQIGGPEGALAVECSITPSGDDPYPFLRWLMFDVQLFATRTAERLRTLAALDPWPPPDSVRTSPPLHRTIDPPPPGRTPHTHDAPAGSARTGSPTQPTP